MYYYSKLKQLIFHYIIIVAACVAESLERKCKDLVIFESPVRMAL
jgi:hypothetical protein